jgi:hypothetical protein
MTPGKSGISVGSPGERLFQQFHFIAVPSPQMLHETPALLTPQIQRIGKSQARGYFEMEVAAGLHTKVSGCELMTNEELDGILKLQLAITWAGEGDTDPPRLGWWGTGACDEFGGVNLLERLAPRTRGSSSWRRGSTAT